MRHDRISRIRAIRVAEGVETRYRFRGKPYLIAADAGFDPASGTFWIRKGRGAGPGAFCEAIAGQLIFRPAARPVHLLALEKALELEIDDPSFTPPAASDAFAAHGPAAPGEDGENDNAADSDRADSGDNGADTGEAIFGHSPFEPDATRNIPKPRPLPADATPSSRGHPPPRQGGGGGKGGSETKPAPEIEKEHAEALKRDHYASHCQMCLCERSPEQLAPPGSYIEWEEVRRRIIEAHHVDLKSAGGARHAGNLIVLCKLHHDNFGRRLTRAAVTAAIQGTVTQKVLDFRAGDGGPIQINGRFVELVFPDTGEVVELFFTVDHASYWLSHAARSAAPEGAA